MDPIKTNKNLPDMDEILDDDPPEEKEDQIEENEE